MAHTSLIVASPHAPVWGIRDLRDRTLFAIRQRATKTAVVLFSQRTDAFWMARAIEHSTVWRRDDDKFLAGDTRKRIGVLDLETDPNALDVIRSPAPRQTKLNKLHLMAYGTLEDATIEMSAHNLDIMVCKQIKKDKNGFQFIGIAVPTFEDADTARMILEWNLQLEVER